MKTEMTSGRSSKILVVDDTTANLQLLTNLLTGQGYTVYPASDGELALEFVRTTLPDLILLDIRMPDLDGFEVCRRLKADERTRGVPVIFISILENEHDKVEGFQAGAVDYITKPFQPEEVLARLQTHLRLRELSERQEQVVGERTAELRAANQRLEQEAADRRRAEGQIALLHFALDHVGEEAYLIDESNRFHYANAEACRVLGYTPTELLARGVADVDPDFPVERWPDHWRELKEHGSLTFEGRHQTKDGRIFPVEISANYFEYEGQGFNLALVRDITARKEEEEELRRLKDGLELRVKERTAELEAKNEELEKLNRLFVGRELRMAELKGRIAELQAQTGEKIDAARR